MQPRLVAPVAPHSLVEALARRDDDAPVPNDRTIEEIALRGFRGRNREDHGQQILQAAP